MSELSRRVALLHLAEDEANEPTYTDWLESQPVSAIEPNPISSVVLTKLKARLGTPAMPFFLLYWQTRQMLDGAPAPEEGLANAWRDAMRALNRAIQRMFATQFLDRDIEPPTRVSGCVVDYRLLAEGI